MPSNKTDIYRRGEFVLRWDRKTDGTLRSPYLAIVTYDPKRRRTVSTSTGTSDIEAGKLKLDAHYLKVTRGEIVCPTCGQHMPRAAEALFLADAIANYLTTELDKKASASAIKARLAHVVNYLSTLPGDVRCSDVDDDWVEGFRQWAAKQPIVTPTGKQKERSLSTVENSVLQLAAVINHAYDFRRTGKGALFRPIPTKEVNRTPTHRSSVAQLAEMFAYATNPDRKERRKPLHRFLIISVATLARPDAALDVSTAPERGQWHSNLRVLNLNPKGRRQTKKYRPTLPIAKQVAPWLDATKGFFVPVASVRAAWRNMAAELTLPKDGESGMKLIRRSMAKLLRDRLPKENWVDVELVLGHSKFDSVSDIYAPSDPSYCAAAKAEIEKIIDEIEAVVPGAFSFEPSKKENTASQNI
ncbi:phage integrase SAM-like domain-containing protein [Sphingomonas kaistensis]|uniref:Phage integrase SAM-like domain-containing protein n=1 Tax=Sphingomonas kaistensis TaxID=298708 RepID=A0ABZ2G2M7_9SPHN